MQNKKLIHVRLPTRIEDGRGKIDSIVQCPYQVYYFSSSLIILFFIISKKKVVFFNSLGSVFF